MLFLVAQTAIFSNPSDTEYLLLKKQKLFLGELSKNYYIIVLPTKSMELDSKNKTIIIRTIIHSLKNLLISHSLEHLMSAFVRLLSCIQARQHIYHITILM